MTTAPTAATADWTEIVRKRRYYVKSIEEVGKILLQMKHERFQGSIKFDLGCGGTVTSIEVEERQKL